MAQAFKERPLCPWLQWHVAQSVKIDWAVSCHTRRQWACAGPIGPIGSCRPQWTLCSLCINTQTEELSNQNHSSSSSTYPNNNSSCSVNMPPAKACSSFWPATSAVAKYKKCSKIPVTSINIKTTSYWHHVRPSDPEITLVTLFFPRTPLCGMFKTYRSICLGTHHKYFY